MKRIIFLFLVLNSINFIPSFAQTFEWEWILVKESQEIGGAPTGVVYLYIYNEYGTRFDYQVSEDGDGNLSTIETKNYKNWKIPENALSAAKTYRTEMGWIYYIIKTNDNNYKIYRREYWEALPEGNLEFGIEVTLLKTISIER